MVKTLKDLVVADKKRILIGNNEASAIGVAPKLEIFGDGRDYGRALFAKSLFELYGVLRTINVAKAFCSSAPNC